MDIDIIRVKGSSVSVKFLGQQNAVLTPMQMPCYHIEHLIPQRQQGNDVSTDCETCPTDLYNAVTDGGVISASLHDIYGS